MEKSLPLPVEQQSHKRPTRAFSYRFLSFLVLGSCIVYLVQPHLANISPAAYEKVDLSSFCTQPDPLFPPRGHDGLDRMWEFLSSVTFQNESVVRHSGAIQIATQSFDDMGKIGEDKRWDVMYKFADFLKRTFPRMHTDLKFEKVNTHGLLYTWQGSDKTLKPLLLMAHQDVVPVPDATVDAWTHPPFSGYYDGKFIWGRGSSDCKNQLIAVMETIELFLAADFKPKRTIVMAFGFDEEISGREGAGHLAPFLIERYGENGIAAIVDEGAGLTTAWGTTFATPGTGEKGYTDVHVTIRTPGGHSSIPTDHTSIGIVSELITAIEAEHYPTYLTEDNPFLGQLQCGAKHGKSFPKKLKKLLSKRHGSARTCVAKHHDHLAQEAARMGRPAQYLMQTSQAVDVITGGVKVNALPERTTVTINHRINVGDSPETVWTHLTELAKPLARKYNLTLHAFDGVKEAPSSISLWPEETTLRVAPVTPTEIDGVTPFSILAATTRALYGEDIIVSPGMMTGNTDTRYYWPITKHIFRYGPGWDPTWDKGLTGVHTVDEKISVINHINMVKWFTLFIRNMDEAKLE